MSFPIAFVSSAIPPRAVLAKSLVLLLCRNRTVRVREALTQAKSSHSPRGFCTTWCGSRTTGKMTSKACHLLIHWFVFSDT